jgi:hypothetical protein
MPDPSNPLAGLTGDQADEAIARLAVKIDQQDESLKAAKAHLKLMRQFRKELEEPSQGDPGVDVHAEPAQISVEAGDNS